MSNIIISDLEKTNNENQLVDILPNQQQLVKGGCCCCVVVVVVVR